MQYFRDVNAVRVYGGRQATGEARLQERDVPYGYGLEHVLLQPLLRVDEPETSAVEGVLLSGQELEGGKGKGGEGEVYVNIILACCNRRAF